MWVGKKAIRMSSGKIRHFKSHAKAVRWEKVARAYKHGWRPKGRKRK